MTLDREKTIPRLMQAEVLANVPVCREHLRLVLALPRLEVAAPGQFLHLGAPQPSGRPFLRRAFSIAGRRERSQGDEVDILYRVVGASTHWMADLRTGDAISALGPLGRGFALDPARPIAWLVAGGVGLPPLLWWAESLLRAGKQSVAFCGARTRDLMPLEIVDGVAGSREASRPVLAAREFIASNTPVVFATDDGTLGFHGTVAQSLAAYHSSWGGDDRDVVVYCCGPDRMMEAVARWALGHGIECQLCMEREMACGAGTCQSCAVAVNDGAAEEGWRYALCCTEGPVFNARDVLWS